MSKPLDPRITPARPDLADSRLKGRVQATDFVEGEDRQVRVGVAPLRRSPSDDAPQISQLLFGEPITLFEERNGWAWVQSGRDNYVGYTPITGLSDGILDALLEPTHKVAVPAAYIYPSPNIKTTPIDVLPMGSLVTSVYAMTNGFVPLTTGGWIYSRTVQNLAEFNPDYVQTALGFLGCPYLWGGKSWQGFDCSGLVQIILDRAGVDAPRDADMQEASLGEPAGIDDIQSGDFVFWKGHVGIMIDPVNMVHANAHHMMVTVDSLDDVIGRAGPVTGVKRF